MFLWFDVFMFRFCTTVWTHCRSLLGTVLKLQLVANWNWGHLRARAQQAE